ncbi:MAG: SpoIIE family protein phosphatase [Cytophagales bacterium]|nr:SpoIIE family protein phosphatase [Bernardetiaceae bacterium]MDW8211387.1 SpoIIE family protein phosphatase [Cytophagales bacterium]
MKPMLRYYLFAGSLLLTFTTNALADDRIDQLLRIVSQDKKDARQVDAMNELAELYAPKKIEEALYYAKQAEKLSRQIGYIQGQAKAFEVLGTLNAFYQQKHDDAADYFKESYQLYYELYKEGKVSKEVLYDFITKKIMPAYQLIANKTDEELSRRERRAVKSYKTLQTEFTPVLAEIALLREQEIKKRDSKLDSAKKILESSKTELQKKEEELRQKEAELQIKTKQLTTKTKEQVQLTRLTAKLADSLRRSSDSLKTTMDSLTQIAASLKMTTEMLMLHKLRLQEQELKALEQKNRNMMLEQEKKRQQWITYIALVGLIAAGIIGLLIFQNYRAQKRLNAELTLKNAEIERQKEEIMMQNHNIMLQNAKIEEQRDKIHAKNQQILASLNYASRIQSYMLPSVERIRQTLPEFFVFYKPRDVVSGDFYWFADIEEGSDRKIIIAAADCTGHGVPGGFMSMIGNKLLDEIVYMKNIYSPDQILNELHQGINKSLRQNETRNNDGMDISICVILPQEEKIQIASAKNPVIYIQNEELYEIKGDKLSVGGVATEPRNYSLHEININQLTTIYMFSDGIQDQFGGPEGKKFMLRNLRNQLVAISDKPAQEQHIAIENILKNWMEGYQTIQKQIDDMMLIGFKVGADGLIQPTNYAAKSLKSMVYC